MSNLYLAGEKDMLFFSITHPVKRIELKQNDYLLFLGNWSLTPDAFKWFVFLTKFGIAICVNPYPGKLIEYNYGI